jgi:hypothetical protein
MTWRGHRPTSVPWPRGVPLRSTSSRSVAATGVAAIPLARFCSPRPPVKGDASRRHLRVCPDRDRRIFERSAAPMGFPCTDETLLAPHGAFIRRTPARPTEPEARRPRRVSATRPGFPDRTVASDHRDFKERRRRAAVSVSPIIGISEFAGRSPSPSPLGVNGFLDFPGKPPYRLGPARPSAGSPTLLPCPKQF